MTEEDDIDGLAAEYVLGSLDAPERAGVEARGRSDASFMAAVEAWQRRLAPLTEQLPGVVPPPELFDSILSRISGPQPHPSRFADAIPLRRPPRYGRRLAIGAAALAACFAVAAVAWFAYPHPRTPMTQLAAMDCGGLYKDFWRKLDPEKYAKISAEQLAGVSRMALRAYDACQAGDEPDADALFGRLRRMRF
jgi:anti-sigma-K factor RskA